MRDANSHVLEQRSANLSDVFGDILSSLWVVNAFLSNERMISLEANALRRF